MTKDDMTWEVQTNTEMLSDVIEDITMGEEKIITMGEEKATDEGFEEGIYGYEIYLIRKGNKHGKDSWGWDSAEGDINDKITLFSDEHNSLGHEGRYDTVPKRRWIWALNTAQMFCDVLNKQ